MSNCTKFPVVPLEAAVEAKGVIVRPPEGLVPPNPNPVLGAPPVAAGAAG